MKIKAFISKNKGLLIVAMAAILITVVVQLSKTGEENIGSPTSSLKNTSEQVSESITPTPSSFKIPSYSQPPLNTFGKVDTGSEDVKTATVNKNKIKNSLPIYIKDFQTSVGISTNLYIYTLSSDPNYLVHIEIHKIDYEDMTSSKEENPNVVAFMESFNEVKRLLASKGIDIKDIYFTFGQKTYIQETADLWIQTYNLLEIQ